MVRAIAQSPGRSLLAVESYALRMVWPSLFGKVAVQLGCVGPVDLLDACNAPVRAVLDLPGALSAPIARVHGEPEALPFDSRSVDLMLLPHTLEFCTDPHQVLREVSRVLAPEGHVVVLGFNPFSLWGQWRLALRRRGAAPWTGNFLNLVRLKDWLKLLDFEFVQGSMLYYRPPVSKETTMERLRFLDKAGDRWWPMAGAGDASARRSMALFEDQGWGHWAIEVVGGSPFIGFAGLAVKTFAAPFTPCTEVGWRLARDAWGHGYATEAARAAVEFGFRELGLAEIVSYTTLRNARSIAVMERLGMRRDIEFDHPLIAADSPVRRHVLYRLSRASR